MPAPGPAPRRRVLVVEDDESTGMFVRRVLTRAGFAVEHVESAERALPLLTAQTWEALLTDLQLPGMSGVELARVTHDKWPALPVAVMTAYGTWGVKADLDRIGVGDMLAKPLMPASLVRRIEDLVEPPGRWTGRPLG